MPNYFRSEGGEVIQESMVYNKLCVKLLSNLLGISGLQSVVIKIAKEIFLIS